MHRVAPQPLPGTLRDPLYPDSDGEPMSETDFHAFALFGLREALQDFFAGQPDVYVATNLLLYFEEGNPAAHRDPDVLVARGVGNHFRRSFRTWEEHTVPHVLFEIASERTWRNDLYEKRPTYEQLGVAEYFLFDPEGLYLRPHFRGFRLLNGVSLELTPALDGSLVSAELGLRMRPEGAMLRLIDEHTGEPIPTRSERAEQARQRAEELAAEVARLRALLPPNPPAE
jgi:Uma2 family endonuclease